MINSVVAVGTFDGLHRGHQCLINRLLAVAEVKSLRSIVVALSAPVKQVSGVLSTVHEKEKLLAQFPIDEVIILPNTSDITNQPATYFLEDFLIKKLKVKEFIVGQDFALGKGRKGDIDWLFNEGKKRGVNVEVIKPVSFGKNVISSSLIRKMIIDGDLETANKLLGSFYLINSKPVKGRGVGTKLGFPTVNLVPEKNKLLPQGVFTAWCSSSNKTCPAVVNIGYRPTFFSNSLIEVEAHLLNFDGRWTKNDTSIYLAGKIRNELKFNSPDELKKQIALDVSKAKKYFALD